ncbi:hypothetical protein SDRG_03750 [Saprolegnia diclina VS20]|uniref:Uncharacterized protein n=1 Tax=Saprolegnia diclina (strain VS20) TaxID=1156394 RepID=T0QVT2_SAPDV|nr:hypothetical protein SDRG_03750 [Saprolegnia diclina VS20]EQC38791.1 hypothetical protein SDRG_03750 [Saprolegnia diclina VS20]|eukprot:XP_008607615.1 hypothetical protein SDRG_03750 [Saprolegnia diclina VS20]
MKASWPAFTPGTLRLAVMFACLYTIAVTLVLLLQRRSAHVVRSATTLHATPIKATTSLYHENCSYQSYAFAEQYEAMAAHPVMPPPGLAKLQRARPTIATKRSWRDCLPVRSVICGVAAGDQDSLFTQHPPCRSAVLHHLLVSTMAAMEARGHVALPIGAALEHMWEHGALPPATPVLDILTNATDDVADWLWARGLAHFYDKNAGDITCLAAHHPLASRLYAGNVASYEVPPHLRWSRIDPMAKDDKFRISPQHEHAYRYAQLTPPTCLRLYNVSILAPAHPPTFFTAARGMRDHDGEAAIYPNPSCQALCENGAPRAARNVTPNVARCPLRVDAVFDTRLATFLKDPIPLVLDVVHTPHLAPFNDTAKLRAGEAWEFCLPMKPQQCGARRGVKSTLFETPPGKPCRSAVLQLLLENMLEVTYDLGLPAFVYFGTLLGAWRDEAIIPHTRDIDIVLPSETEWAKVQDAMWARGFYVFKRDIHGACVASHHPLAGLVYAPNTPLVKTSKWDHGTPYLDLCMWRRAWRDKISVETALEKLDRSRMFPLQCNEKIFGNHVPGIQDPEAMFRTEYSTTYAQDPDLHLEACESYCDYQVLSNATTV